MIILGVMSASKVLFANVLQIIRYNSIGRVCLVQILGEDKVLAIKCTLDKENCNEKEVAYIEKTASWESSKVMQELERIQKMLSESRTEIKKDLLEWMNRRKNVLEQLVAHSKNADAAEL